MKIFLLKPEQVDMIFQWPLGKSIELAKQGRLPFIWLPDGSLRFERKVIFSLINPKSIEPVLEIVKAVGILLRYGK